MLPTAHWRDSPFKWLCSDLFASHGIGQYSTHVGQYRRILVNKSALTNNYLVSPMVGYLVSKIARIRGVSVA